MVKDLSLSDRSRVFFDLLITPEALISTVSVEKRYIDEITIAIEVIAMLPIMSAETVDVLLGTF